MENYLPITAWKEDDRPREKMLLKGRSALSDAELIAILLGSGTRSLSAIDVAKSLLNSSQNNLDVFGRMSLSELKKTKGVGDAKAITLMAAIELGRRRQSTDSLKRPKISSSQVAFELLQANFQDLIHEEFYVLYLDKGNFVLAKKQLSIGGISGTMADGKLIFKYALELNATAIVLAHNHPSGRTNPSNEDIRLTKKLKEFGEMIEVQVLDHLIVADKKYYSFADEGIL